MIANTIFEEKISIVEDEKLFEEQKKYILENKDLIFERYMDIKIGFDLNLTIYVGSIVIFHLMKKFDVISKEIRGDKFLTEHFGDVMDSLWIKDDNEDFLLKESMKKEAEITLITDYVLETLGKEPYTTENVLEKEKEIKRSSENAANMIDEFFGDNQFFYQDLACVSEIYEVLVSNEGKQIDLHFGSFGYSLYNENSFEYFAEYIEERKRNIQLSKELIDSKYEILLNLKKEVIKELNVTQDIIKEQVMNSIGYKDARYFNFDDVKETFSEEEKNLENLLIFLRKLKNEDKEMLSKLNLKSNFKSFNIRNLSFEHEGKNPDDIYEEYENYISVESFINNIKNEISEKGFNIKTEVKNNLLYLEVLFSKERLDYAAKKKSVTLLFEVDKGKIRRETGEEVLTCEAVEYQLLEQVRLNDEIYVNSVEKAKEMLISVLSEEEEKMFLENDITILEGEENYYGLVNLQTFNNVIQIPKAMKSMDEVRALCIHPSDSTVPMYDGFATIALSIKSGDEDYVLSNSNAFRLNDKMFEKVKKAFSVFEPLKKLNFA